MVNLMIDLYIGPQCPECEKLKPWIPEGGVRIIDTSTNDGYAEAMLHSVYSIPCIIMDGVKFQGFYQCRKLFIGE